MCGSVRSPILQLMDRPTPLTLTLTVELQLTDDAFSGRARDDLGGERDFHGWLGLIAALDELVDTAPARSRDEEGEPRDLETSC